MRRRPLSRAALGSAVFLVSSSAAFAQTGAPAPSLPVMVVNLQTPEEAAGCPIPTLAECQDPDFLFEERGCGAVQSSPDGACMSLMLEEVDARSDDREVEIVPKSFDPSGVSEVVKHPADPPQSRIYQPDLYSYSSRSAARDLAYADEIGTNQYEFWAGNGSKVTSCEEYVFEKFYDVNEFLRVGGPDRVSAGRMVDIAFGPAYERESIGTRHVADARLRGFDGRVFGKTIQGQSRQKNRFFGLKNFPSQNSEGFGIVGAPPLLDSLKKRSLAAAALLAKITASRASGSTITETWAWHRTMHQTLRFNPDAPAFLGPQQIANPNQGGGGGGGFNVAALGTTGGQTPIRRRLDKELDELYRMQKRVDEIMRLWSAADARFQGSGWTIESSGLSLPGNGLSLSPNGIFVANGIAPKASKPAFKVAPPPQATPIELAGQLEMDSPETVIRKNLLDELASLLVAADAEGCLEPGLTACDWSPQLFAERAGLDLAEAQDYAYDSCVSISAGNLSVLTDLDVAFVDDPDYPQFQCSVVTGPYLTAASLEKLAVDVAHCREQERFYLEAKAADEARNRVRAIPELIDESTGEFKFPGGRKSRDELMGSERLGLTYAYDFGFLLEAEEEICKITVDLGGDLYAAVKAFGSDIVLLDARAWASTVTLDVDVYTRVINKSIFVPKDLFEPVHVAVEPLEPIEFNVVKSPQTEKDQKLVESTFVVVVVPISIEVGVSGRLGVNLGVVGTIQPPDNEQCPYVEVDGLVEPFLGIDAYIAAAIDVFIAEAGIRGDINVITVSLPFRPGVTLRQLGGTPVPSNFQVEIGATLDLALSTLSGRIQAYAEIGFCPLCADVERTVVEWEGPRWDQNLFDQTYIVNMGDLGAALFP